ncbi:MAG: ATP-binding protein [Candidatus Paceibacterota bacterium]
MKSDDREYKINIDPRILELLGPSLYTNIYYVLGELIANAYDASASNVYIIQKDDCIIVEDDGTGMSYSEGDIGRYLNVAVETRTNEENSLTVSGNRKRMGRKGVGKLAALSVSENVFVMTRKNNDRTGFVLSRHVGADHKLKALDDKDIKFEKITGDGTSIVMTKPQYGLHKTAEAIRKNIIKLFPLVSPEFKIHILTDKGVIVIDSFDKEIIEGLGALLLLGDDYKYLEKYFNTGLDGREEVQKEFLKNEPSVNIPLVLENKDGSVGEYNLEIKGWIGVYQTTRDRKNDPNDFPDNFISLLSNGKLGEYNILPIVGKNRLNEVYVVGQLHVELFEETKLPDMSLSNRQGYKTDDLRYVNTINYVRDNLLPQITDMRKAFAEQKNKEKNAQKFEQQKESERLLKEKVEEYKKVTSKGVVERISDKFENNLPEGIKEIVQEEINRFLPIVGIKKKVDSQKKRILISQTRKDKPLSDIIYKMLSFNGVPDEDIIYTNSESEECRIPNRMNIFEYLRGFFVDSYSDEKMFVIYVTSEDMSTSWGAVSEVGAGWITQSEHDIFNVKGHRPQAPLNIAAEWQTSEKDGDNVIMTVIEADKFVIKIGSICDQLGYKTKSKSTNEKELKKLISIKK